MERKAAAAAIVEKTSGCAGTRMGRRVTGLGRGEGGRAGTRNRGKRVRARGWQTPLQPAEGTPRRCAPVAPGEGPHASWPSREDRFTDEAGRGWADHKARGASHWPPRTNALLLQWEPRPPALLPPAKTGVRPWGPVRREGYTPQKIEVQGVVRGRQWRPLPMGGPQGLVRRGSAAGREAGSGNCLCDFISF